MFELQSECINSGHDCEGKEKEGDGEIWIYIILLILLTDSQGQIGKKWWKTI